jgi:uncharacterized membrane protein YvbJ
MGFCEKCGNKVEAGMFFCDNCGVRLGAQSQPEQTEQSQPLDLGQIYDNLFSKKIAAECEKKRKS